MFSRIQSHHCRKPAPNVIQKKIKHFILIIAGAERKWEIQSCSTVCVTYVWAGFYHISDFSRRSINEFWVCCQRKVILLGHGFAVLFEKEGHGLWVGLCAYAVLTGLGYCFMPSNDCPARRLPSAPQLPLCSSFMKAGDGEREEGVCQSAVRLCT